MLRNYFITALRYIIRNKIPSLIQVLSLTIGITAVILIGLYVDHELRYDKFNEKLDRIYRLEYGDIAQCPSAIGHEIKENFTEVENVVRISCGGPPEGTLVKYVSEKGEKSEKEVQFLSRHLTCDSTIFDVFTLPFIQGDPKTALKDPFSVVITESVARAIFGNKDPVGETIELEIPAPLTRSYIITGIIHETEDFHIDFDILTSLVSINEADDIGPLYTGEKRLNSYTFQMRQMIYLLLSPPHDKTRTEKNINDFSLDKMKTGSLHATNSGGSGMYTEGYVFSLRPLKDIYFSSPLKWEEGITLHGNLKLLKILLAIAAIILLLACINYINLTTARASLRAREVGVRKVVGSLKSRLMAQFLVESVLISLISFLLAITIVQVLLPTFNQLTGHELSLERLLQTQTILFATVCIILLGVMAGIYPAVYMTTFQPVASLKGEQQTGARSVLLRRILLTFQFAISVVLMIGVFTILRQLKYMKTADLGFNKELVISFREHDRNLGDRHVFKESLLNHPNIEKVASGIRPGDHSWLSYDPQSMEYNGNNVRLDYIPVDTDYFELMDIKILEGRNWSGNRETEFRSDGGAYRIIVNETTVREFEMESPVGAILHTEDGLHAQIIGVVEDIHFHSLHNRIDPSYYWWSRRSPTFHVKILPYDIPGTIKFIKKEYESLFPDQTFRYSFLDETYDQQYESDERLTKIIGNFAIVAILIACLGLFGLSSFMAARRTKEIGIRKAMGASIRTVFLLLSREFIKWIILSVIIACPVAWFAMNRWLQDFAYRTNIAWWIFALAILIAFAIAFATITWQSLKTARTNPVEALRYE